MLSIHNYNRYMHDYDAVNQKASNYNYFNIILINYLKKYFS